MESNRVKLKVPQWDDMQFIRHLWGDSDTMKPVGGPVLLNDEQARRWFEKMIDPGGPTDCYRLILNEEDQPIGEIGCHRLDLANMTGELNIKIISSERTKGYAKEAIRLFLEYYFYDLGGRILIDGIALNNKVGQQMLLQCGFEHDASVEEMFMLFMTRQRYDCFYNKLGQ